MLGIRAAQVKGCSPDVASEWPPMDPARPGAAAPSQSRLDTILGQAKRDRGRLDSGAMGAFSLTTLGIASVVGAGIFVTTGEAASQYAGPGVVISFALAGIAAALTAICYAEMAAMIPIAGSTYSYAYAAFGSFLAWFIGWDLLLEYLFAASTVAVGWSGYAVSLLDSVGVHLPHDLAAPPFGDHAGVLNVPAIAIVAATTTLLVVGMRQSARANNAMVILKMGILLLFVGVGAAHVMTSHWTPFVPHNTGRFGDFGLTGVVRGAGVLFFAYIGFDAVSTAAGESRNPQRTVPIGLLATVVISTVLYIAIGLVLTGLVPYSSLNVADPISKALRETGPGVAWLDNAVDVAAVVGLASTVLVTFYGQTRILMRMAADGMLPVVFNRLSPRSRAPVFTTVLCGVVGAIVAGLVPIDVLGELVSIGTLLAFLIVCSGVLVLRRTHPDAERPFRVPALPLVAGLGIVSALALIATLPVSTFIRLVVWLLIGLCIYFAYARRHTAERFGALATGAGDGGGGGVGDVA
jgi:APA family basic amino acid/polyamine antiporter